MKITFFKCLVALCLSLCFIFGGAQQVFASASGTDEMVDMLSKAFDITKSDYDNYDKNYAASLPLTYGKTSKSHYLALGGATSGGLAVVNPGNCYTDKVADKLGVGYTNKADNNLAAATVVSFVKKYASQIAAADLITLQVDGASFIISSMDGALEGSAINWNKYVSDSEFLTYMKSFRGNMKAEYGPKYGEVNAEKVAIVLEYVLYECVVYCIEMMDAVKEIRKLNNNAVILAVGIYNPLRNLAFTAEGQKLEIGKIVDNMIKFCNIYLLKNTLNMKNVAFIDASGAATAGFGEVSLSGNENGVTTELLRIISATNSQYANQTGHDHLRDQVIGALKEPCKHTNTTVKNAKKATCQTEGYSGDTYCNDCGATVKVGKTLAKTSHAYGDWTETKAPTCSETGEKYRTCTVCGKKDTASVDTIEHTWDEGTVTKEPGCETEGEKTLTCTVCGSTTVEAVPPTGHTWDEGTVTKEPTCGEQGEKLLTCTVCGKTETAAVDADENKHVWGEAAVTKEPTCGAEGEKTRVCASCGKTEAEPIAALEHKFGEYVPCGDADCSKDGTKKAICEHCGASDVQPDAGSRTGHAYEAGVCIYCGEKEPSEDTTDSVLWIVLAAVGGVLIGAAVPCVILFKKLRAAK